SSSGLSPADVTPALTPAPGPLRSLSSGTRRHRGRGEEAPSMMQPGSESGSESDAEPGAEFGAEFGAKKIGAKSGEEKFGAEKIGADKFGEEFGAESGAEPDVESG
ncbi:unnamed protein product, partial [Laminaria digitata]